MNEFFRKNKIIGMIHLMPLPGSPKYQGDIQEIIDVAMADAEALVVGGINCFIIENFNDDPYAEKIDDFSFALMVTICQEIKRKYNCILGVNIQFNDYEKELALAYVTDAKFIRVEVFIDTRIGIEGTIVPKCREISEIKRKYNIDTLIFADIDVKHTTALVKEDIVELAYRAKEAGADAIILTGNKTGENPRKEEITRVRQALGNEFPLIIGSGFNSKNARQYLEYVDAAIVGSSIKINRNVKNAIDKNLVCELVDSISWE